MRAVMVAGLVSMLGIAVPALPASEDEAALADRAEGWQEAFNAGDLEAVVALYTEEARILPPDADMAQGEAAAREILGGMIEAGMKGELDTVEVGVEGELGYRVGTFTFEAPDGSAAHRGKFIEIWERVDGEWKISNDIWNSSMPAAEGDDHEHHHDPDETE